MTALVHLVFDALTVYTVARLDSVPRPVNDVLHRLFIGSMVLVVYLFYQYIAVLIEEETGKPRRLDLAAKVYLAAAELGAALLPVHYAVTPQGNYSDGIHANVCYASVAFYLLLCAGLLFGVMLNGCGLWEDHALGIAIGPLWGMAIAAMDGRGRPKEKN